MTTLTLAQSINQLTNTLSANDMDLINKIGGNCTYTSDYYLRQGRISPQIIDYMKRIREATMSKDEIGINKAKEIVKRIAELFDVGLTHNKAFILTNQIAKRNEFQSLLIVDGLINTKKDYYFPTPAEIDEALVEPMRPFYRISIAYMRYLSKNKN